MNGHLAEEWVPVEEALNRVADYEREGRAIVGLEAARITRDQPILLPALADFSGCNASESWAFARRLLAHDLPAETTHVSFDP
jgi:hypothetical protein